MTDLRYNPRLDGLRCLAVFGVLPVHFVPASWFLQYADTGNLGVKLFFVLSGYLITAILLEQRERVEAGRASLQRALAAFYARRFLRLTPVYFAYLVAALVLVPGFAPYAGWYFAYLQNFLFAAQPEVFAKYLAHFWTLAIEEQFYLLMPALLLAVPRRRVLTLVLALVAAGSLFRATGVALGYGEFALKMMMLRRWCARAGCSACRWRCSAMRRLRWGWCTGPRSCWKISRSACSLRPWSAAPRPHPCRAHTVSSSGRRWCSSAASATASMSITSTSRACCAMCFSRAWGSPFQTPIWRALRSTPACRSPSRRPPSTLGSAGSTG
ncbi:MAG: acyltransferase [Proteobacteria bacterium]|nr:acyltransferase [Pseudomonadota bacterium]